MSYPHCYQTRSTTKIHQTISKLSSIPFTQTITSSYSDQPRTTTHISPQPSSNQDENMMLKSHIIQHKEEHVPLNEQIVKPLIIPLINRLSNRNQHYLLKNLYHL
ncbi:unnamed protein product [Rotaria magnacalcarata]|uniref:Uncharacterized protein n=1 Tax=Rotaria magnacalcarata TaxID=392030 RepID=A0A815HV02_9BILA|nr:unnamed protein product [Rotaria magnacalcarata]CAF3858973.1 unnamed protein product [Rotaria magnacalcarata]CAF4001640.1 unnamed protein product [Rotaria magnacalcarata]CAF4248406.1 unnamed protein product [Rotaria magnacalcarata]